MLQKIRSFVRVVGKYLDDERHPIGCLFMVTNVVSSGKIYEKLVIRASKKHFCDFWIVNKTLGGTKDEK